MNAATHLAGLLAALPAAIWLVYQALATGGSRRIAAASVFGLALIALFAASTLCHSARGRYQQLWVRMDHGAIFLLIAATMTPFAVMTAGGWLPWMGLASVWMVALWGVAQTVWGRSDHPMLKLYLAVGWLASLACIPALRQLPADCVTLFIAGAVTYTAGTYFFVNPQRRRHGHAIWHVFVVAGSGFHYCAVVSCVLSA